MMIASNFIIIIKIACQFNSRLLKYNSLIVFSPEKQFGAQFERLYDMIYMQVHI